MKLFQKWAFALCLMAAGYSGGWADSGSGNGTPGSNSVPIVLKPHHPVGLRPKAPSMQQVNAVYSNGTLTFEFAIPEGQCQLVLSDPTTGETVAAGFDSAVTEPVYVGYHATAALTVTTANGNTYTGMW